MTMTMTKLKRLSLLAPVLLFAACTVTKKEPIAMAEVNCMTLGDACSKLHKAKVEDGPGLVYINEKTDWTRYHKIMIQPVTFWAGASQDATPEDQQRLVNYFNSKLHEELAKTFEIVTRPGPGVIIYSAALGDVESSTPVMRSISMFVPQAHMLSNIAYLATDKFPFVGRAVIEAKGVDAETGELLAAEVDRQAGGGMFTNGAQWKWGDAEHAIDFWIEREARAITAWTKGTIKPGDPLPK